MFKPINQCALCRDPIFRGDRWVRDRKTGAMFCCRADALEAGVPARDLVYPVRKKPKGRKGRR